MPTHPARPSALSEQASDGRAHRAEGAVEIPRLLIDTSSLRNTGLGSSDLQRLLLWASEGMLKIYVAEISWEEWRTQLIDKHLRTVEKIRSDFTVLNRKLSGHPILGELPAPELNIWELSQMVAVSKVAMQKLASVNKIEVVKFNHEHATRAWSRYFERELPFSPLIDREETRKDIPDSWILEVVIDLIEEKEGLLTLCSDENLRSACKQVGAQTFKDVKEVMAHLQELLAYAQVEVAEAPVIAVDAPVPIEQALIDSEDNFRALGKKVFGFIAWLEPAGKKQLFDLLEDSGMTVETARNVAERLAITHLVNDLGTHYVVADKGLAPSAMASVEDEVIELLAKSTPG